MAVQIERWVDTVDSCSCYHTSNDRDAGILFPIESLHSLSFICEPISWIGKAALTAASGPDDRPSETRK